MITIKIGESERALADAEPGWINQQINCRRQEGVGVCVRVTIHTQALNIVLTTPGYAGGVGGRPPTRDEQAILDLWQERGLTRPEFTGSNLVAFLRQLERML